MEEIDNQEEIKEEVLIDHLEKCIKQPVLNVEMKPKYPLFQHKESQYIAVTAFKNADHIKKISNTQ
jgi:hypothetical protein